MYFRHAKRNRQKRIKTNLGKTAYLAPKLDNFTFKWYLTYNLKRRIRFEIILRLLFLKFLIKKK